MKTWKIVSVVSLLANLTVMGVWLSGHLKYERYSRSTPIETARLLHGDPMDALPEYSRRMAVHIIRAYDDFVLDRTGRELPVEEAYNRFFAASLAGYNDPDWDFTRMIPPAHYVDGVARVLFREPVDLLPIVDLNYVSPAILSGDFYGAQSDEDQVSYSGWHLGVAGGRDNIFFRSMMNSNRQWAFLIERALAWGDFLPPGFLSVLRDHPGYFDFGDEATRLYIALTFIDRYIQYNPSFRLVI